jgi:hypothetical protein
MNTRFSNWLANVPLLEKFISGNLYWYNEENIIIATKICVQDLLDDTKPKLRA